MEVEAEQCNDISCSNMKCRTQIEEGYHYIPLFRVSDREKRLTNLYFNVVFEMSNDLIPFLYTSGAQCYFSFFYPNAFVYLKVNELAMKEIENIAHGNLPGQIKIVTQPYWFTPRFETQEKVLLNLVGKGLSINHLKGLEKSISAVVFDRPLPPETLRSSPSLWSLKMSPKPLNFLRFLSENQCEEGVFKSCDIGSLLSFDPFDLETEQGTSPGTKIVIYPPFDFAESYSHIKDILLLNSRDMIYISETSFQPLPKELINIIIETYTIIIQDEFIRRGEMVYQTEVDNIKM